MADLAEINEEIKNIPRHVGIIMDGNGRWARGKGLPRVLGHEAGMRTLEDIVDSANDFGIRYLSLYAFSTENWKRMPTEIDGLMKLFRFYLKNKVRRLHSRGGRIRFVGRVDVFPPDITEGVREAEELTKDNSAIDVIILVNYGGRQEIVDAVNRAISESGGAPVTEESLSERMYAPDIPPPDLLIRTGGELRMSNFWLWQGAYSEYYFTDAYWPDFGKEELRKALMSYSGRDRRYGAA
jgi:undecaprenyl diphosphate synthase